jgi:hypothetical protein
MYRLKESHPLFDKFVALAEEAERLGLYLSFSGNLTVTDVESGVTAWVDDIEGGTAHTWGTLVTNFPPETDFKLTVKRED